MPRSRPETQSLPRHACAAAIALVLAVGGAAPAANAQEAATTSQLIDAACDSNVSNVEYKECLAQFAAKADRDLNVLWPRVLAAIEASSHLTKAQRADWRAKLTIAQRHWVLFRQADCREPVGYEWYGGTGMGGAVSICLAKHTLDRMLELKQRYLDGR